MKNSNGKYIYNYSNLPLYCCPEDEILLPIFKTYNVLLFILQYRYLILRAI